MTNATKQVNASLILHLDYKQLPSIYMVSNSLCFLRNGEGDLGPDQARNSEFFSEARGRMDLRERVRERMNLF